MHSQKSISESCSIISNLDCNYAFLIESAPNRIPFAVPSQSGVCNYSPNLVKFNMIHKTISLHMRVLQVDLEMFFVNM